MKLTEGKLLFALAILFALEYFTGFVFVFTPYEFVFRQSVDVTKYGILLMLSTKYPLSRIVIWGLFFMSLGELIEELYYVNTEIRTGDYVWLFAGLVGIAIALAEHRTKNKTWRR